MVELDVKITSGDLYDFLLRHSYNSVSGLCLLYTSDAADD